MGNVRTKITNYSNTIVSVSGIPDHYVNLPAQMKATDAITRDGVKVIPAGTCVSNATDPTGRRTGLKVLTGATPGEGEEEEAFDGVIFADAYVAEGETMVNVSVMVHGFPLKAALQKVGEPKKTPTNVKGTSLILVD